MKNVPTIQQKTNLLFRNIFFYRNLYVYLLKQEIDLVFQVIQEQCRILTLLQIPDTDTDTDRDEDTDKNTDIHSNSNIDTDIDTDADKYADA